MEHDNSSHFHILVAELGLEPRHTPSGGTGFRDRDTNHYVTRHSLTNIFNYTVFTG